MTEDRFRFRAYEKYLVVNTSNGTMRLVARRPDLLRTELAYQVTVRVPIITRAFPAGRLVITTPDAAPGGAEVQVSDQPVVTGGLMRHVFRGAELDATACARCGLGFQAAPHICSVEGCAAEAASGPDGAPLCVLHAPDPGKVPT